MTILDTTRSVLDELFSLWDKRAGDYGQVLYGTALVREGGVWKNVLTFILPLHKDTVPHVPLEANYGHFRISRGLFRLEDAKKVLTRLVETDVLCLPNLPEVALRVSMHPSSSIRPVTSAEKRFPSSYPFAEFRFGISDSSTQGTPPYRTLYSVDLPTYPRGDAAIEDLLNVHLGDFSAYKGELVALAPDYRARIAELRLSTRGVQIQIECLSETNECNLLGKLYYESRDGKVLHTDILFTGNKAQFEATDFPRYLNVGLLSKTEGTLLDERVFYAGAPYTQSDVVLEASEQDIERLVLAGESAELEFKRELPREYEELALEAAAFANTNGGRILMGVDDNGRIVGFSTNKGKETIANILRDYSEPNLEFSYVEVIVQGNSVVVITIPAGKNKPYVVRNKGVYVRSGATKRAATRYELDQMYGQRTRPF